MHKRVAETIKDLTGMDTSTMTIDLSQLSLHGVNENALLMAFERCASEHDSLDIVKWHTPASMPIMGHVLRKLLASTMRVLTYGVHAQPVNKDSPVPPRVLYEGILNPYVLVFERVVRNKDSICWVANSLVFVRGHVWER